MNEQQTKKQPYVRPVLKQIELKTNEVFGVKCNNPGESSFVTNLCGAGCSTNTSV